MRWSSTTVEGEQHRFSGDSLRRHACEVEPAGWRIGRPAMVLSPTRTIRDQWILRLKDYVDSESHMATAMGQQRLPLVRPAVQ
jgi:hypothetical protein